MKSHRQFVRRLRRVAIGLVAIGALVSVSAASALEDPGSSPSAGNVAGKVGDTPADFPRAGGAPAVALGAASKVGDTPADFPRAGGAAAVALGAASKVGDTPADFPRAGGAPAVALSPASKVGDTPADFPGAGGARDVPPTTIQVVRPERTVVRDVNEALPIALSGAALLIVLMGAAFVLVRVRLQHRHAVGRSH